MADRICKQCKYNLAAPQKTICHSCKTRNFRKKNPVKSIWYDLKHSAKRRFIKFDLPFDWFDKWIRSTKYLEMRGRGKDSLTIDRREEGGGYTIDNVQVIKKSKNVSKYHEMVRRMSMAKDNY